MRKTIFATQEYYHIYNRGVDKRTIFEDSADLLRFLQTMKEFNTTEPRGGIYVNAFIKNKKYRNPVSMLVTFVAYCLNQNHYHFILTPLVDNGIQKFMHKLSLGYTKYFNEKYKRSGALFQGNYKAIHIETNEYLLHLSVYINVNDRAHSNLNEKWLLFLPFSSFDEY
ncbi:transposase, partial [Patescibacteria group bacterium]|nr:transposase [Patescibacteria group bacterium]